MKKALSLTLALVLALSVALTGCSSGDSNATPAPTQTAEATPTPAPKEPVKVDGGIFTMGIEESITSPAWYVNYSSTLGEQAMQVLYDPLWLTLSDGSTKFYLAESYDVSEDGTEYIVHLRQNAYWHDGEQVTADDMIYTLSYFSDPECTSRLFASRLKVDGVFCGFEKVDDFTVKVTVGRASNFFVEKLGYMRLLPEHLYSSVPAADVLTSELNNKGIGTGAFKLVNFVPGEKMTLTRNENYYRGRANIETLEFKFITNTATQEVAFRNGELSMYRITNTETLASFEGNSNYTIYSTPACRIDFMEINPNSEAMSTMEARQAVIYALNLDEIILGAYGSDKLSATANSVQSSAGMFYNPKTENYQQNIDKAKELVKQTGLDGKTLRLIFNSARVNAKEIAVMVQSQLQAVGINVEIDSMETSGYFKEYFYANDTYDLALMGVDSMGDPGNYAGMYNNKKSGANMYTTDEVNNLWTEIDKELDPAKRQELIDQVDAALKECYSCVPIADSNYVFVTQNNVRGIEDTDLTPGLFRDWLDVYFVEG